MTQFLIIVEDKIKLFEEPKFDDEGILIKDSLTEEEKARRLEVNLNNDILNTNCGVPLIFIVNKSDSPFPKYADKSEFILKHIRKIAISYGASIIYTSTKKKYNIKVLYDYIFYILFNCDLVYKSNIHDKTSYFIPSGYDRFSLLKSSDINHDIDADYFDMIKVEEKMKTLDEIMEKEIKPHTVKGVRLIIM